MTEAWQRKVTAWAEASLCWNTHFRCHFAMSAVCPCRWYKGHLRAHHPSCVVVGPRWRRTPIALCNQTASICLESRGYPVGCSPQLWFQETLRAQRRCVQPARFLFHSVCLPEPLISISFFPLACARLTPLWAQSILYCIWQKTGVNKVTNQRGSASFCLVSKLNEIREGSESARAGIAQLVSREEDLPSAATLGKWAIVQQVGYWQAGGVLGQFAMAHFCSWRQKITVLPLIFPPNCFSHDPKANVG